MTETGRDGAAEPGAQASLGGRVLLVEDNEDDAELIGRAFRKARIGNPIHLANDGDRAVAALGVPADELPVLVLLDLKLPRRSGFEVLQWIRGNAATRRLPVVVLTSSRQSADVRQAYDLGANSYLVKPVGSDALTEMVRTLNLYWCVLNQAAPAGGGTAAEAPP